MLPPLGQPARRRRSASHRRWDDVVDDGGVSLPQRLEQIEARIGVLERRWALIALLLVVDTLVSAGGLVSNVPGLAHAIGL